LPSARPRPTTTRAVSTAGRSSRPRTPRSCWSASAPFWRPLEEHDKPWLLRGQSHGTQVALLGHHERHDTTQAPESVTEARRHWIARYLNTRFRALPDPVEVLVHEPHGQPKPGELRRIHGERHHVEQRAITAGTVELSDATVQWWVLDDDHRGRRHEAGAWASSGHAAAVLGDELYDGLPQTRGGYGRLQDFGIRFGYERVVLHLEPRVQHGRLEANTARTMLLLDHEPLPWSRWGNEFAATMPEELLRLQERVATSDGTPRREAIRSRVGSILPLYRLSRYRPTPPPGTSPANGNLNKPSTRTRRAKPAAPTAPPTKDAHIVTAENAALPDALDFCTTTKSLSCSKRPFAHRDPRRHHAKATISRLFVSRGDRI
jgi:hypothetical protein